MLSNLEGEARRERHGDSTLALAMTKRSDIRLSVLLLGDLSAARAPVLHRRGFFLDSVERVPEAARSSGGATAPVPALASLAKGGLRDS